MQIICLHLLFQRTTTEPMQKCLSEQQTESTNHLPPLRSHLRSCVQIICCGYWYFVKLVQVFLSVWLRDNNQSSPSMVKWEWNLRDYRVWKESLTIYLGHIPLCKRNEQNNSCEKGRGKLLRISADIRNIYTRESDINTAHKDSIGKSPCCWSHVCNIGPRVLEIPRSKVHLRL